MKINILNLKDYIKNNLRTSITDLFKNEVNKEKVRVRSHYRSFPKRGREK